MHYEIECSKPSSYLWQELRGIPTFRLQTSDQTIARRLQKRNDFQEIGFFINGSEWLFQKTFYSNDRALQSFRRVTRLEINYNAFRDEYYTISPPIVDIKMESDVLNIVEV
jgi:hypothetical protein